MRFHIAGVFVIALIGTVATFVLLPTYYPDRRVLHWFEFMTDGWMHPAFANVAQDGLGKMWMVGFGDGIVDVNNEVASALERYLSKDKSRSSRTIVELAAGGGIAPCHWTRRLREDSNMEVTLLLTDLQPNAEAWQTLAAANDYVQYMNTSVDATNLDASLGRTTAGDLRMIHLALHHFPPELVKAIFADTISSKSAILVTDLAPNAGGVIWNSVLALFRAGPESLSDVLDLVQRLPWWGCFIAPFMPAMAVHDATVSVLRAYSAAELEDFVNTVPGADSYQVSVFSSGSYGDWIGIPRVVQDLWCCSTLRDPVLQHFLLGPRRGG